MYYRCPECRSANWTRFSESPGAPLECGQCGKELQARNARELGLTAPERFGTVKTFARSHGIDMPSACSILLGVMTIEQAAPAKDLKRVSRDPSGNRSHGRTTRGPTANRRAAKLVQWYGLPKDLALEVANQRLSLHQALKQIKRPARREAVPAPKPQRRRPFLSIGVLLMIIVVGVGFALHSARENPVGEEPGPPMPVAPSTPLTSSSVYTDGEGRIIKVRGSSPESVLIAYCENNREMTLAPVEIASALPPRPDVRIGIVKSAGQPSVRYALELHRFEGPHDWSAGDGREPIALDRAPKLPPGTPTIPVSRRR